MRFLHSVHNLLKNHIAIWPFEETCSLKSVIVEIYPRLFMKMARIENRKLRSWTDIDLALNALGSGPAVRLPRDPTDHEADALVSAAGLRLLATDPRVWSPPGLDGRARRQEGWIFGVGLGSSFGSDIRLQVK